jgi:hypothetical protein
MEQEGEAVYRQGKCLNVIPLVLFTAVPHGGELMAQAEQTYWGYFS